VPSTKANTKSALAWPIPIPDFNRTAARHGALGSEACPLERHPSPKEIYLVVEVSETTLKQDQGQKLLAYQDAGIPEYWMVDVAARGSQDTPAQTKPKPTPQETHSKDRIALQAFPDVTIPGGESLLIASPLAQGHPRFFPTIPFPGKLSRRHNRHYVACFQPMLLGSIVASFSEACYKDSGGDTVNRLKTSRSGPGRTHWRPGA
jgi:Putative restriction endonuclease